MHSRTDSCTKHIEITAVGLDALRAAMPMVMGIQQRMFGEGGAVHGPLLQSLREVEANL